MSANDWKQDLQPFAEAWNDMRLMVEALDDEALTELHVACKRPTVTNCWFATHYAAPIVAALVVEELGIREQRAKRLAPHAQSEQTEETQ